MAVGAARRQPLGLGRPSHKKENKLQSEEKSKSTIACRLRAVPKAGKPAGEMQMDLFSGQWVFLQGVLQGAIFARVGGQLPCSLLLPCCRNNLSLPHFKCNRQVEGN